MTQEEIIQAIHDDKMMPLIQPEQLSEIVNFVIKNYKPSLPSNLDEAAEEIASDIAPTYPDVGWDECFEKIKEGIKAGVEWMAGQGITVECGVRVYPTLDGKPRQWVALYRNGIQSDSLLHIPQLEYIGFEDDDTAIVQIRKK